MDKVLVICGATATGKTKLAVKCAKLLNSEVVSADSQLVYRGLNIGTAKPTQDETGGVVHRVIDIVDPREKFTVADYRATAKPCLDNLISKGKIPVICGGTGFYINSLLFDFGYGQTAADENVRKKYENILAERGRDYLFSLLEEQDKETAKKLHPNDVKRVVRALEILEVSGQKKSELHDGNKKLYDYTAVAVDYPRAELYARIEKRVDDMFDAGLVDEVTGLLNGGVDESCQSMQAIGYKEVIECLKNGYNHSTMRDIIKKNTRHYAKRQITFFKKLPDIKFLAPQEATAEKILELLNE